MRREWKPGDVALVTDDHGIVRVAVCGGLNPRMKHRWHYDEAGIGRLLTPLRPLVVIDPESAEDCERLGRLWNKHARVADALREFADPKPPRPEEPTGLGAVVEDSKGVRWVRSREDKPGLLGAVWENSAGLSHSPWTGIDVVRVLSEGVQQ